MSWEGDGGLRRAIYGGDGVRRRETISKDSSASPVVPRILAKGPGEGPRAKRSAPLPLMTMEPGSDRTSRSGRGASCGGASSGGGASSSGVRRLDNLVGWSQEFRPTAEGPFFESGAMTDELSSELASLRIDRSAGPQKSGGLRRWLMGLAVLGGAGWAVVAWGLPFLEAQVFKTPVSVTQIAMVSPAQASVELTSTGYVTPQQVSRVVPKVGGRVAKVAVAQGQQVKAGDLLLELDPSDQKAAVAVARSRVAAAQARLATASADVETARAQMEETAQRARRERTLAKANVVPAAGADDLEARVRALSTAVTAAEARTKAAAAEVQAARAELHALEVGGESLTLHAPIDGTIVNKPPELGEFVGPQPAGISVDMGGVEIANLATLVVETDVPEGRLHLVKPGGPAEIVLDAFPNQRHRGEVLETTPKVNRAKATVTVKVKFVDAAEGALPDMAARVSFLTSALDAEAMKEKPKTIVPGAALVERSGSKVVFVLEEGKVRIVPVTVGEEFGSGFVLEAGPAPGTRIVKDPPANLSDGQKVKEETGS